MTKQKLINYITFEEFRKLLKAEKDKRYKLIYILGFGSGLRLSEIVGLKKRISSCCEAEIKEKEEKVGNKKIKFNYCSKCNKNINQSQTKEHPTEWQIKPLQAEQVDLKAHQIRIFGKGGKERITVTSPGLNKTNIQLLPIKIPRRTIQYHIAKLSQKVLGKKISPHTLRHGFGNYMVNEKNLPMPQVQRLMGHSRIDTTGIYTKANPKKAVDSAWEAWS